MKAIAIVLASVVLLSTLVVAVADKGVAFKGKPEHLYLYEKDPSDWSIVEKGASVRKYDLIGQAQGNISTNIHASIDGRVADVNEQEIVIQR